MRIAFQKVQTLYLLLCTAFVGLFLYLSTACYYSDSEIWLLAMSKKTFSVASLQSIYYKWLFHVVVFITSFWTSNNLLVYEMARMTFALIALASVLLIAVTFSKVFQKKQLILPIVLVCLTSSLFFNQGFRVRADILALFFHACFLFIVFHHSFKKHTLLFTALNIVLLLTTPKALIFIALQVLIALHFCSRESKDERHLGKKILISVLVPLTVTLFALSCLAFFKPYHTLLIAIQSAGDFYLKSFEPGLGGAQFLSATDFMYVLRFLRLSTAHTLIFLAWLTLFFVSIFSKAKYNLHSFFNVYCTLLLSLILLYNQKLPFFLGPFLTPALAIQFCTLDKFTAQRCRLQWLSPLLLALACWLCWKQFNVNLQFNNNFQQKEFISQLQTYKKNNPAVSVYDIIGLLPQDNTYYLFTGPGEVARSREIESFIHANPPDIYLYTYKNIFFTDELRTFLQENYLEHSPGVWLKANHLHADRKFSQSTKIVHFNSKNYWLLPYDHTQSVYSRTANIDITADCLFLDSELKATQIATKWVAIPLEHLHFSLIKFPTPKFYLNPFILFRFDIAF
jgi:hypothetical protein